MVDKIKQMIEKKKKLAKIKPFLRPRIKEKRRNFLKLPNFWWTICLAISAFLLCGISFYFHVKGHQWIPNVLVSIACGIVTGLVLYFLSNIRNNKIMHIKKELRALSKMKRSLYKILNLGSYYNLSFILRGEISIPKPRILAAQFLAELKKLEKLHYQLSTRTLRELSLDKDDPFTEQKMAEYELKLNFEGLDNRHAEKKIMELSREFYPFIEKFEGIYRERKDMLYFLGTYWI